MRAYLHSARLAPKKANIIAKMVRGMSVPDAVELLRRTSKKGARMFEGVLRSAIANAEHNSKQDAQMLVLKTVIVNQGTAYRRGVPMARGRVRPIKKFLSHIAIELGVATPGKAVQASAEKPKKPKNPRNPKKVAPRAAKKSSESSDSSDSSVSSSS